MSNETIDSGAAGARRRQHGLLFSDRASPDASDADAVMPRVRALRARLEEHQRSRARRAGWTRRFAPTGLTPLDDALPHGGLPRGAVIEVFSDHPGVGSLSLALRIAASCARERCAAFFAERGSASPPSFAEQRSTFPLSLRPSVPSSLRPVVLVDTQSDFYPPASCPYGLDLRHLIVIRAVRPRDAFWAVDQTLRCSGVAAVITTSLLLDDCQSRRLALAAASSGCLGIVLRSARDRRKSFAAVQMLVEGVAAVRDIGPPVSSGYPCRVTLLKVREGMPAGPILVDVHHETGACDLRSLPVDPAMVQRA